MVKNICYLFPGQGSQYAGMGRDLYDNCIESRRVFEKADAVLPGINIKRLCFEAAIEELTQTANSQVAILVVSIAALNALRYFYAKALQAPNGAMAGIEPVCCAGLSLGELSALVASNSITFEDSVCLVRRRGELMEDASKKRPGKMVSILGLSIEDLKEICSDTKAEIANFNCPGQTVLSGTDDSINNAIKLAEAKAAKKTIVLNVNGAFHSSLMREAAMLFKAELSKVKFYGCKIPIVSNVTADYERAAEEIKENLVRQLYSPVRWEDSIRRIAKDGCDTFIEIGPGKVLKGLLRRIDANLKVYNIEKIEDIELAIRQLGVK